MHMKPAAAVMPNSKNHSWWFNEHTQRHDSLRPVVNHCPIESIIRMADLLSPRAPSNTASCNTQKACASLPWETAQLAPGQYRGTKWMPEEAADWRPYNRHKRQSQKLRRAGATKRPAGR